MIPAIVEIHFALLRDGYTEEEADALAARLMEEEAFDFVECTKLANLEEDIVIH